MLSGHPVSLPHSIPQPAVPFDQYGHRHQDRTLHGTLEALYCLTRLPFLSYHSGNDKSLYIREIHIDRKDVLGYDHEERSGSSGSRIYRHQETDRSRHGRQSVLCDARTAHRREPHRSPGVWCPRSQSDEAQTQSEESADGRDRLCSGKEKDALQAGEGSQGSFA